MTLRGGVRHGAVGWARAMRGTVGLGTVRLLKKFRGGNRNDNRNQGFS